MGWEPSNVWWWVYRAVEGECTHRCGVKVRRGGKRVVLSGTGEGSDGLDPWVQETEASPWRRKLSCPCSRMQFQQLLSVLRPQGPPSFSISVPPLTPLSPGPLESHTPLCIFPHKFSSIVFHKRSYWQVVTHPSFSLKFLEVRNDIFKCHQIVRGYIVYFLSFFVCSTEGKKTEHFHFHVKTGSHMDIRTHV